MRFWNSWVLLLVVGLCLTKGEERVHVWAWQVGCSGLPASQDLGQVAGLPSTLLPYV